MGEVAKKDRLSVEGIRAMSCLCGSFRLRLVEVCALWRVECTVCGAKGREDGSRLGAVLRWNHDERH